MIFTIEPMLTAGDSACREWADNWTVVTKDGSVAAQFEVRWNGTKKPIHPIGGPSMMTLSRPESSLLAGPTAFLHASVVAYCHD